jgi:hypothetical protein
VGSKASSEEAVFGSLHWGMVLLYENISNESGSNESGESKREEKKMGVGIKEVVKKII